MTDSASPPHCRDDPPWGDCGDPRSPDFGSVFAWRAASGGRMLTYDAAGRRHALTLFDAPKLGPEVVIQGRRFTVTTRHRGEEIA